MNGAANSLAAREREREKCKELEAKAKPRLEWSHEAQSTSIYAQSSI